LQLLRAAYAKEGRSDSHLLYSILGWRHPVEIQDVTPAYSWRKNLVQRLPAGRDFINGSEGKW